MITHRPSPWTDLSLPISHELIASLLPCLGHRPRPVHVQVAGLDQRFTDVEPAEFVKADLP